MIDNEKNFVSLDLGDGNLWQGWSKVSFSRSIEAIASEFKLELTTQWPEKLLSEHKIFVGATCNLTIGNASVLKGYVDCVEIYFDSGQVSLSVSGRSRTGDLVDCSVWPMKTLKGLRIEEIADRLCSPFDIAIQLECDTGDPIRKYTPHFNTVFHELDRLCAYRSVLKYPDAHGNLVLARAGDQLLAGSLEIGRNISRVSEKFCMHEQMSEIIVLGQSPGGNSRTAKGHAQSEVLAQNSSIRYRPFVIIADELGEGQSLQQYADWQIRARSGHAQYVEVVTPTWRDEESNLYDINKQILFRDPIQNSIEPRLIAATKFVLDETGYHAYLQLFPPTAFNLSPVSH